MHVVYNFRHGAWERRVLNVLLKLKSRSSVTNRVEGGRFVCPRPSKKRCAWIGSVGRKLGGKYDKKGMGERDGKKAVGTCQLAPSRSGAGLGVVRKTLVATRRPPVGRSPSLRGPRRSVYPEKRRTSESTKINTYKFWQKGTWCVGGPTHSKQFTNEDFFLQKIGLKL